MYALRWHALPETLPPKRADNDRWSQRVWLAMPNGEVVQGDCHFAGPDATHGHAVHAWFGDNCQLDADPIAWMPYAKPDHRWRCPHRVPHDAERRHQRTAQRVRCMKLLGGW